MAYELMAPQTFWRKLFRLPQQTMYEKYLKAKEFNANSLLFGNIVSVNKKFASVPDERIQTSIMEDHYYGGYFLDIVSNSPYPSVQKLVAEHYAVTDNILMKLISFGNIEVAKVIADMHSLSEEVFDLLAELNSPEVDKVIVSNYWAHPNTVNKILRKPENSVVNNENSELWSKAGSCFKMNDKLFNTIIHSPFVEAKKHVVFGSKITAEMLHHAIDVLGETKIKNTESVENGIVRYMIGSSRVDDSVLLRLAKLVNIEPRYFSFYKKISEETLIAIAHTQKNHANSHHIFELLKKQEKFVDWPEEWVEAHYGYNPRSQRFETVTV